MSTKPMLLQYAVNNEAFDSPNHIAELKFDGYRLNVSKNEKEKLYTKQGNEVTSIFPELLDSPLESGTELDGEVILNDEEGRPDFESLQARFRSKKDRRKVTFCAFDILKYKGVDTIHLPLYRRKEILNEAFTETDRYKKVRPVKGSSTAYFELVKQYGLEGIVIKDLRSRYEPGRRSWAWQKVINWIYVDVYITGYRKNNFGWLTSVENENGTLRPTGIIEHLTNPIGNKREFNKVKGMLAYKEDKNFVYLKPLIKAKIKTRNWTNAGMLRSPVFVEFLI